LTRVHRDRTLAGIPMGTALLDAAGARSILLVDDDPADA
jgi:hypothetical protein